MWLFTNQGFYSVVAHREDAETLIVRARDAGDIEALRDQIPGIQPFEDASADYRYRAHVSRSEWVAALAQLTSDLDYDNFKSEVARRQGADRARLYGHIWGELLELQR